MFPNVRLLIGALLASLVALSCGFGLFAAFRVNHEPLSQLPVGNSSVQLVANEVAAPRTGWGTPFDGQARMNGPQRSEAVTEIPLAAPLSQAKIEASSTATAGAIKPAEVPDAAQHDATQPAVAAPAQIIAAAPSTEIAQPAVSATATTAPAPLPSAAAPMPADSTANPANSVPDQTASVPSLPIEAPAPAAAATATPSPDAAPVEATNAVASPTAASEQSASAPASAAKQQAGAESGEAAKAPVSAIATALPDQSPAVVPPAEHTEATPDATIAPIKAEAKPTAKVEAKRDGKAGRKPVARRRVVLRKRIVRRWRTPVTVRNSGFGDPVFQSAPNSWSASAARSSNSTSWRNAQ